MPHVKRNAVTYAGDEKAYLSLRWPHLIPIRYRAWCHSAEWEL